MLLDVKWKCSDSDETHRVLVSYTQEFRSDSGYGVPNWYMIFQQKFIRRTYSCFPYMFPLRKFSSLPEFCEVVRRP
jgi:hypothetical protein